MKSPVLMRTASLAMALMMIGGCCLNSGQRLPSGPPPGAQEVTEGFNRQIANLDRLWSRTTVRIVTTDESGAKRTEQGEGYLQAILPDMISLSVGKYIDRQYILLGSSAEDYWWFDMSKDDDRRALVGKTEFVTPALAMEFGAPVHPLDLVDLLAFLPLDPEAFTSPAWAVAPDGRVVIMMESTASRGPQWGARRIMLDPTLFVPVRVELIDRYGDLVASNDLRQHETVNSMVAPQPRIAMVHRIELPTIGASISMSLTAAERSDRRPVPRFFDLRTLLEINAIPERNIERVEDGRAESLGMRR